MQENSSEKLTNDNALPRDGASPAVHAELLQENAQLKEACENALSTSSVYTHIALSLARGYTDLFYVNMDTDEFIEFHTDDECGVLTEARRGSDFFEGCERDAKLFVHADDQQAFIEAMNREFLLNALAETNVFELVYRRIKGGDPFYVRMRVSRMEDDDRLIVLAVADVDEQIKQRRAEERMIEERIVYARLHALTGNFIVVYVVDPETGYYREFTATDDYVESFAQAKEGEDFFGTVREVARTFNHPDDMDRFLAAFTKENIMAEVERSGIFTFGYRLMMDGNPVYVQLKAAMVEEREGPRLVVGINDIDAQVRQEEEAEKRLAFAQAQANVDALTGVKNRHAYLEVESRMNLQIEEHRQPPFAIVILDVNNLKRVNDSAGHQAGDQLLRTACKAICDIFKHSPVFRVGGDEFAVLAQGEDYEHIEELLEKVNDHNAEAFRAEGAVVACGMSRFDNDPCVSAVFERADKEMYENKGALKADQNGEFTKRYIFSAEKRSVLESLRQPFAIYQYVDKRVVALMVSDGFCNLFGYAERDDAVRDMDNDMYKDVHPDDIARIASEAVRFAEEGGTYEVVYRTRKKDDGSYVIVHALGEHVYMDDGTRLAQVWYTNEGVYEEGSSAAEISISGTLSNALHEQSIINASQYDYLTGLPTMSFFFEFAEVRKATITKRGCQPTMLYIDFSGMKFFNTKNGFAQGDRILQLFARLMSHAFSAANCCRIGADHFAAIAEEEGLEDKLNEIFSRFEEGHGAKLPPVHVGIYPYRVEDVHVSLACDRAKHACSAIKGSYVSAYNYYSAELREEAVMKQYVVENLDTAIREKWIQVYYQPIIRSVNEKVCDVEALARWIDPEKGVLSPACFIPALEDAGLIYKLDLCVLEQVLECIKMRTDRGLDVVPHSINLSRVDFDACDIVEEIRERVDAAGVDRNRITIEITESVVGSDFEFIKEQVNRFQDLGFPVWMDDFGSGYSSIDALQSIKFDLLKFDMSFMRKLDEGEGGKVVLTELVRMATSLGLNTVCEGVETESQVRFLQEIGCSKLQGFYYSKPLPFDEIKRMSEGEMPIESENPGESEYFESMGRVNLYDLAVIAQGDEDSMQNTFDTLPMGIIEVRGDSTRFVRSNQSYRDFIKRYFGLTLSRLGTGYAKYNDAFMRNVVKTCCEQGLRSFYDEKMPDGSIVHSFARRIGVNPVTGDTAIVAAVLSIADPKEGASYADIARALAVDYYNIYVVNLDNNSYVEYSSLVGGEDLSLERHGENFFETARNDAAMVVYEKDRKSLLARFTKENVMRELSGRDVFSMTYRLVDTGKPVYANMKITKLPGGNRIIIGVSNVDAQMRQQEEEKRLRQEKAALARVAALSENYIVLYTVDCETEHYTQYNPSNDFEKIGLAKQGHDFFADVKTDAPKALDPEDLEAHARAFTKENMMREMRENGRFVLNYRLLIDGKSVPVCLRAVLVEEEDGEKIILGVSLAE